MRIGYYFDDGLCDRVWFPTDAADAVDVSDEDWQTYVHVMDTARALENQFYAAWRKAKGLADDDR